MALTVDTQQGVLLTALQSDMDSSLASGISGGYTLEDVKGYNSIPAQFRILVKKVLTSFIGAFLYRIGIHGSFTTATLQNSFTQWGDTQLSNGVLRYYKDAMNIVRVQGLVGTPASPNTKVIFTLPAGYRPAANDGAIFPAVTNNAFGAVSVYDTGEFVCVSATALSWLSINVSFRAGA